MAQDSRRGLRELAVLAAAFMVLAPAAAGPPKPLPDVGFPYWPASARAGRPVPLPDGAAFRRAMRRIASRAREAGWIREGWDQARDTGSVDLWFARPNPDGTEVGVHLSWHPKARRGELTYTVGKRQPAPLVHGFPICTHRALEGKVQRSEDGTRASAPCRAGGFDRTPGARATRLPVLYGWKDLGPSGRGFLFVRGGVYVVAATRHGAPRKEAPEGPVSNQVFFHGHHDPRRAP